MSRSRVSGRISDRSWRVIAEVALTGTGAITFSAIPQSFTHLQIVGCIRSASAASHAAAGLRLNADTGNNYDWTVNYSDSSTPLASNANGESNAGFATKIVAASATAGKFSAFRLDLPNYRAAIHKALLTQSGHAESGVAAVATVSTGMWRNTAAVTQIDFWDRTAGANSWASGSALMLLGI